MTLIEIGKMTILDLIDDILNRLYDASELPFGEVLYTLDPDTTLPLYGRINLNPAYSLVGIAALQDEKDIIISELIDAEKIAIAKRDNDLEIARVSDFNTRIERLEDIHYLLSSIGKYQSNAAIATRDIVNNNDILTLELLEAEHLVNSLKKTKVLLRDTKKANGAKKSMICSNILNLISGDNDESLKSDIDIDTMMISFKPIYDALKQNRPALVKTLVSSVVYDGIIDTLKDDILEELKDGGY